MPGRRCAFLPALVLSTLLAALLAVAGCAGPGGPGGPGGASNSRPAPSAAVTSGVNPGGPASSGPSPTGAAASGTAGGVAVTISGIPAQAVMSPGGPPLTFTVTLRNEGASAYRDVTPVVSMGHCGCTGPPVAMAPAGTLLERDPATGNWRSVSYNAEGGGTDFLLTIQQPGITLAAGATAGFTFRVAFSSHQPGKLHPGSTAIDVSVVQLPQHNPLGQQVPTASVPIQVRP